MLNALGARAEDSRVDLDHSLLDTHLLTLDELLLRVLEARGSDLHLTAGSVPMARVNGALQPIGGVPKLTPSTLEELLWSSLTARDRTRFVDDGELDTSYSLPGLSRFRVNVYQQRNSLGAVMRVIPHIVPDIDKLGMPDSVRKLAELARGLVLVTGPTGSGKSTTLASLIDYVNRTQPYNIVTVEDPIEFLHEHKRSIVNQREVGTDTESFSTALRQVLRQDPNVILIGEMRDLETISIALRAAETGHLVFGTLHTQGAAQTVNRVIDVFPPEQQGQIRTMLASTLQGVVSQQLVPTLDGRGRCAAVEVLLATSAVRNMVRENKVHQILATMQSGRGQGMITMDSSLASLVRTGKISVETAIEFCSDEADLRYQLGMK
ncbi:MAG: type IV pilus twitching motility protein PilT [Acidimicrobiia bacterium]